MVRSAWQQEIVFNRLTTRREETGLRLTTLPLGFVGAPHSTEALRTLFHLTLVPVRFPKNRTGPGAASFHLLEDEGVPISPSVNEDRNREKISLQVLNPQPPARNVTAMKGRWGYRGR